MTTMPNPDLARVKRLLAQIGLQSGRVKDNAWLDITHGVHTLHYTLTDGTIGTRLVTPDWASAWHRATYGDPVARACAQHEAHDPTCVWCKTTQLQWDNLQLRPEQQAAVGLVPPRPDRAPDLHAPSMERLKETGHYPVGTLAFESAHVVDVYLPEGERDELLGRMARDRGERHTLEQAMEDEGWDVPPVWPRVAFLGAVAFFLGVVAYNLVRGAGS